MQTRWLSFSQGALLKAHAVTQVDLAGTSQVNSNHSFLHRLAPADLFLIEFSFLMAGSVSGQTWAAGTFMQQQCWPSSAEQPQWPDCWRRFCFQTGGK